MIYLKLKRKPKTIKGLMKELFSFHDRGYSYKNVETYSNEKCTIIDCIADKYRSVDDLVTIVQTYFPDATEKEIFLELIKLRIKDYQGKVYLLSLVNCNKISRPTIIFYNKDTIRRHASNTTNFDTDELTKSKYKNWKTVCEIAGITTEEDFKKYNIQI